MKELIKLLRDYHKAKKEHLKAVRILQDAEISIQMLQKLIDEVKLGDAEVKATIELADGRKIVIERKSDAGYKSFSERWSEARVNKGL